MSGEGALPHSQSIWDCPVSPRGQKLSESDNAGRIDDYVGIDTDDDGGNDTDDDGGNVTDDDDDGDNPGSPLGSNREPGLQKRAALHGRRMAKASRPHTQVSLSLGSLSLSGHSHCRLTASQYRSRQTARSVKYQQRQGFFSHGQVVTDCQDSLVHTDHSLMSH
ncbi:hypothetical protein ElyMa_001222700 [Elysia marginata]|uniref:Uncharacterized protein n=1 Tax=Elysia marginata TaxID=1093978 RepID=A0AAV4I7Y9_9GAST|nr:hypothetical protein ElyMa_001222700 [Elysia marginata]